MKQLLLLLVLTASLHAESKYPVDVSYMVADIKYSKELGVKICEVQHGIMSTFYGDVHLNPERGLICPKIASVFAELSPKRWMCGSNVAFATLRASLERQPGWTNRVTLSSILNDPAFIAAAAKAPEDPYDISSYSGMLFMNPTTQYDPANYPGIILMDAPTHPYWADKYKMSLLFRRSEALSSIKPEWQIYKKEYSPELAENIAQDLGGTCFVIKPRGGFLGNGVIIVSLDDLDKTLSTILGDPEPLKASKDKSYNHWARDPFNSFIVERYYPSDLITHEGKLYEPSMRVAFICSYNKQQIDFRFLGGYWMLPTKSIDEEGSLNERKKAYCKPPYFTNASQEDLQEIERELSATIPLLYQEMLEGP